MRVDAVSAQVADYTALIIAVTFIVFFFGLAGYMVKRSMDLDKERLSRTPTPATPAAGQPSTILKEKEVVTQVVKIRCRSCGSLNLETDSFCQNCGARI